MAELEIPEGVQAFNFWTIIIMGRLWDEFPRPQSFHTGYGTPPAVHVTGDTAREGTAIGPTGSDQTEIFVHTLAWLLAERFVSGKVNDGRNHFNNITLTTRGFTVLNQIPHSVAPPGKPLGTQMREAAGTQLAGAAARILLESMLTPFRSP